MDAHMEARRRALWWDRAKNRIPLRKLIEKYNVSTSTVTKDIQSWTPIIAARCLERGLPYIREGRDWKGRDRNWMYYIWEGHPDSGGKQLSRHGYYRLPDALDALLVILKERGIDLDSYPF